MNGHGNRLSGFAYDNYCTENMFITKNEDESILEEDIVINMSQVEESLKTLLTEGNDLSMMTVGSPVQNPSMDSTKTLVDSLVSMTSFDAAKGNLNDIQESLRILNINDKNTMEPGMSLNQDHLNRRLSSTSALCSNERRPNKSIAVVSMKNLLSGVNSSICVDTPDEGDSNSPKAPVIREERIKLLQELLEFYMSDKYLIKDLFFLKRNKGWISIKFLLSYKKIKRIAKDIDELKEAIKMSPLFELNKEETKVQRLNVLPNCIRDYIPSKMAIVGGLPEHFKSINEASGLLNLYGDVVSLQLLRPGGVLPQVLETVQDIPEIRTQWCIVVEYEEMQSAGKLVSYINKRSNPNLPTWAVELVISWKDGPNKKTGKNKRNPHGLTKKERLLTSINGADDQTLLSNEKILRQLGQQQQRQNQQQQQHFQSQKRSNHIQYLKSSDRHPYDPSSADDNWRSNPIQNLKAIGRHQSDPSSSDGNWRRGNNIQNMNPMSRHHSEPSSSDGNWRTSINVGSKDGAQFAGRHF